MDGKRIAALLVAADVLLVPLIRAVPAAAATASGAPGAPGANASWDESQVTGFADSLGASSKVWYTLGNGELENVFYPETDIPDTFGLQYIVTNGTSFASTETAGTSHSISLADPDALVWQQVNNATDGDFTITKTYIADPARSVVLVQTTFDNLTSSPLQLYADYHPQLDNDGMGNTGGTDATSGDLVASNGSVSSALAASTGFGQASTGYVGSSSDGETALTSGYTLGTSYSSVPSGGHIDQIGQIPVAASGSTTFTLALAFDSSQSAAISDAAASLAAGFASLEASFESGWDSWLGGLNAPPASVTGSAGLAEQYDVSLMEVKADEDKTYAGAFVAAPTVPWGTSVSADTGTGTSGAHGYHAVWTRDEYEMAAALLAAGDSTDALAALNYIFGYEVESNGTVKQNTWLNGTAVFGSLQMDEVADPIILAYQLGATGLSDWATSRNWPGTWSPTAPTPRRNAGRRTAGTHRPRWRPRSPGCCAPRPSPRPTATARTRPATSRPRSPGRPRSTTSPTRPPARTATATTSCASRRTAAERGHLDRHRQRRRQPRRPHRG